MTQSEEHEAVIDAAVAYYEKWKNDPLRVSGEGQMVVLAVEKMMTKGTDATETDTGQGIQPDSPGENQEPR